MHVSLTVCGSHFTNGIGHISFMFIGTWLLVYVFFVVVVFAWKPNQTQPMTLITFDIT